VSANYIRNRKLTEEEERTIERIAAEQAADDDSNIDYSDIPPLTEEEIARVMRARDVRRKVPISVRLDREVVDWLKSKGQGHLTRINDILLNLMEAERAAGSRQHSE